MARIISRLSTTGLAQLQGIISSLAFKHDQHNQNVTILQQSQPLLPYTCESNKDNFWRNKTLWLAEDPHKVSVTASGPPAYKTATLETPARQGMRIYLIVILSPAIFVPIILNNLFTKKEPGCACSLKQLSTLNETFQARWQFWA